MDTVLRMDGYKRSLLMAVVASFAAPIVMYIVGNVIEFFKYGSWNFNANLLIISLLVSSFFSILLTFPVAAFALFVLRLLEIYKYDGYAALAVAVLLAVVSQVAYGYGPGFATALAIGSNALTFFILDKYCRSFFGKITKDMEFGPVKDAS